MRLSIIFVLSLVLALFLTALSAGFSIIGFYAPGHYIVSGYGFPLTWSNHYYIPNGCCPEHPGADWTGVDPALFGLDALFYTVIVFALLLVPKLVNLRARKLHAD